MTDKRRDDANGENWPGDEIPGKLKDEMPHGAHAVTDMGEYARTDAERVALGEETLEEVLTDTDDPGPS